MLNFLISSDDSFINYVKSQLKILFFLHLSNYALIFILFHFIVLKNTKENVSPIPYSI